MSKAAPQRVVICGGGVAGIEALLALHAHMQVGVNVDLFAPQREFVYHPLAVAAPFGLADVHRFDLEKIAAEHKARFHVDALAHVDAGAHRAGFSSGAVVPYDALVVAVGARPQNWLDGALHFAGAADVPAYEALLRALEGGVDSRVCFVNPSDVAWTLPLYELALMTAAHLADEGVIGADLVVVTPEQEPLSVFGPAASRALRDLLADRGITLRAGTSAVRIESGQLRLKDGGSLVVDRVVTLARLTGPAIRGLPHDQGGFLPVDSHSRVAGLDDVYAAGDGTSFAVKQGGIATQQADAAAEAIVSSFGVPLKPAPIRPTLRGMLLTGIAPVYLRAGARAGAGGHPHATVDPLWWPPSKIAGRYLAPYLAGHAVRTNVHELSDRAPTHTDPTRWGEAHDEARALAIAFAERDAADEDFASALDWLEVIERLDGVLPPGFLEKRAEWRDRTAA